MNDLLNLLKKVQFLENELYQVKSQIQSILDKQGVTDIHGLIQEQLIKAGKQGLTMRDLRKKSRTLAMLDKAMIAAVLNDMINDGKVVLQELPTVSNRGRKRVAYVWVFS